MIIPFIFSLNLSDDGFMYGWTFLRSVDFCKEHRWPLIAQSQYFEQRDEMEELIPDLFKNACCEIFGYSLPQKSDLDSIIPISIPKEIEKKFIKEYPSESDALHASLTSEWDEMESFLISTVTQLKTETSEKVEAFITLIDYPFLKSAAEKLGMKVIHFEMSTIRFPLYNQTLYYMDFQGLQGNVALEERHRAFCSEGSHVPTLSRKELLALFLNEKDLHYIEKSNNFPQFEVGIACQPNDNTAMSGHNAITNMEMYLRAKRVFAADDICVRNHPADPGSSLLRVANHIDAGSIFDFILNCKRVLSVSSNMPLDAALLGRPSYDLGWTQYRMIAPNSLEPLSDTVIDEQQLNFIVMNFLVPAKLFWSVDYLKYRLSFPSETDLYMHHMRHYLATVSLDESLFSLDKTQRLDTILIQRNYSFETDQVLIIERLKNQTEDLLATIFAQDNEVVQTSLKNHAKALQSTIESFQTMVFAQENEIIMLNAALQDKDLETTNLIASLRKENEEYSLLVAENRHVDDSERAAHAATLAAYKEMTHSFWWRITKPCRMFTAFIKKILRTVLPGFVKRGLRKIINSLRNSGLRTTVKKVFIRLLRIKQDQPTMSSNVTGSQVLADVPRKNSFLSELYSDTTNPTTAIPTIITNEKTKRLNLVTDSIGKDSLLGGVATALIVATCFAQKNDYELRVITRNAPASPLDYENIVKMSGIVPPAKVSFYSDCDRNSNGDKDFRLAITADDIFFATSWWSAAAIQKTSLRKRFFYIIQEVETFFYNHGGEHYLCHQIMADKNIDFIINSHYLYDYFNAHEPHIVQNGTFFEPAFPALLYSAKPFAEKEKYKLFFYARPNNPRNLFNYGVQLLEAAIANGILDTEKWDIYCAGQPVGQLKFSNGYTAKDLGQMSWQKYAKFLQGVDLSLCLMYTPHPSYPPFDAACSGSVVLTNECLNKTTFPQCANVILSSLDNEKMLEAMHRALALAQDTATRRKNYETLSIPRNWNTTLSKTLEFMEERA